MKKNEPLKGKIYYLDTRFPMSLDRVPHSAKLEIEIFLMDDIKSAVRGLLEEIEELIIGWQEAMGKEKMNKAYGNGAIRSLIDAKNLIKKWFSDVLEGGENEGE